MLLSQWAVWVQLSDCCNGKDVPRLHCSHSDDRDPCLPVCPSLYTYTFCTDMSLLRSYRGNRLFMQLAHTNTHAYAQRLSVRLYFCSELQHRLFDLALRWICFIWFVCVFTLPRHTDPCRMQTEIYKVTVNEHWRVYFRQGSQYSVWLRKRPSKVTVRSAGIGWS